MKNSIAKKIYFTLGILFIFIIFYVFSENKKFINKVMSECSFGGGCINDTIVHLATPYMGFGGVGNSGMGSYHGRLSFATFSHRRAVVITPTWLDLPFRYMPYKTFKLVKKLL